MNHLLACKASQPIKLVQQLLSPVPLIAPVTTIPASYLNLIIT